MGREGAVGGAGVRRWWMSGGNGVLLDGWAGVLWEFCRRRDVKSSERTWSISYRNIKSKGLGKAERRMPQAYRFLFPKLRINLANLSFGAGNEQNIITS